MDIKKDLVEELSKAKLLDYTPDMKGIEAILQLKGRDLSTLSEDKLSECVFVITQYQLYLQLHHNIRNIEYLNLENQFDRALNSALLKVADKKLTVKEKMAVAMEGNTELQELEDNAFRAKSKYLLFNKIPDSLIEWGNAIKKELSIRASKKDIGYRKPQ
jgi:hypothetical protein